MFNDVYGFSARSVLLQDDAEAEEGGGVLLRGGLLPRPAPQRQGLQVPDLQGAGPVSTVQIKACLCKLNGLMIAEHFTRKLVM